MAEDISELFADSVAKAEAASDIAHDWVNGTDAETVTTLGGELPTVAKFMKDTNIGVSVIAAEDAASEAAASAGEAAGSVASIQALADQVALDKVATAEDVISTNSDVITTAANVLLTDNNVLLTNEDVVLTNADVVNTGNDVAATNADVLTTASNVSLAQAAQAAAELAYDNFDDRYLGEKASDPTLDNDGNALVSGALYFKTGAGFYGYSGASWIALSSNIASDIANTPAGNISATNVQDAINELDSEKEPADATILKQANVGTTANKLIQLNGSAQLPAVDGSLLTGTGLGVNQTLTDVLSSRSKSVIYTNSTGKAILLYIRLATADGVQVTTGGETFDFYTSLTMLIKNGDTYVVESPASVYMWKEMR